MSNQKNFAMLPSIYKIEKIGSGFLAIMARPRSGEWANEEFAGLKTLGVSGVVSLLELSETRELDLNMEDKLCISTGLAFNSFPIPDRGVTDSVIALSRLACEIYHRCVEGKSVVIHCRAGIGRSGVVAAAVLLHSGIDVKEAFQRISSARGVSVPDTDEQSLWVEKNKEIFCKCYMV
jgi:protein-tyrosine phosphatase